MNHVFRHIALLLVAAAMLLTPLWGMAQDDSPVAEAEESQAPAEEKAEKLDVKSFIFGHTGDSYCFHITEIKGEPVCVWLPVIVKCKDGGSWHCFSSKHICELKEGETLVSRYSPGYGDWPLEAQRRLFELLDAPRKAGVSLTDSLLMVPSKSVSAIIGVKTEVSQ